VIVAAELHSAEEWRSEFVGPLLWAMEAGQCPEWRDISDRSPIYKNYWTQWKSLVVKVACWNITGNQLTETAQIAIPCSKVKEILVEMYRGTSGGHHGDNKTINKAHQHYYWLYLRGNVERWCLQCDACATSRGTRTKSWGLMHQYIGVHLKSITIHNAGPFTKNDRGKRYHHGLLHQVARIFKPYPTQGH
jgi:hypothetical protein